MGLLLYLKGPYQWFCIADTRIFFQQFKKPLCSLTAENNRANQSFVLRIETSLHFSEINVIFIKLPAPSNHKPLWCQLKMMSMRCIRQTDTQKTSCRIIVRTKWQFILIIRQVVYHFEPFSCRTNYYQPFLKAHHKFF